MNNASTRIRELLMTLKDEGLVSEFVCSDHRAVVPEYHGSDRPTHVRCGDWIINISITLPTAYVKAVGDGER